MDKVTLREAFKSIEDVKDEIFDAFEQPKVKVINKKKLNESKVKKQLKESVEPVGEFNFDSNSDATCLLFNNYDEAYEYLFDLKEKQNLDANYEIVDENYFFPQDDIYGLMLRSDDETYEIVAYNGSNKDESLDESEQLDEKLPKDLAKAYRTAGESDRIGYTGVGAKEKRYDSHNSPYLSTKDTRRNVKTDYANSEYKEITPEEALQAKKDGNIGKLRILVNGKLVQYRNDGYPLVGPEVYGDKAYTKKNGETVFDTRKMSFNHIINIADKIYLTDEDEHSIGKGGKEWNYDKGQWEEIPGDSVYDKRQANKDIEDTGEHKEKRDYWRRKSAENYKQDAKEYKDKLAKLEQDYANGDIARNAYEKTKAEYEKQIEYYTKWYKEYNAEANRDDQYARNLKARKRYQVSQDKLQAPLIKLRDLKNQIRYAKRDLTDLENSGLDSWRLQGGSYKDKQNEIARLKTQIEQAQKRIEQLEKESQGLDDANAKQNADAIEKAQNRLNDIQSEIDTLLRRNKNESLNEDYNYDLCDEIAEVLYNAGIMFGDIVANADGTVNIVGVDEDEWDEAQEVISDELGYNVLIPDENHEEFDDELIVTLDESCKKEDKKQLKEATQVDIQDPLEVAKGKAILANNKESESEETMQVVDVDADTVDKLKDSYIGNVILRCPTCKTPIFKMPDALVKDEEHIADDPDKQLWNVGEKCPHCGQAKGFNALGQVATLDVKLDTYGDTTTGEQEAEFDTSTETDFNMKNDNVDFEEEDVTFESLNIDRFNSIANTYLTEVYSNVESFTTTNATVDDENNKLIIEGIINYKSGKSKNTKFEFLGESITEDNKYVFKGLNETFAKDNDKAFTLKAIIDNNTLISESLDYDYTVTNTQLNESKVVKGSTLK